jgi:hypothetical protein
MNRVIAMTAIAAVVAVLTGCFSHWSEKERQAFKENCERMTGKADKSGLSIVIVASDPDEITSVQIERIHGNEVVESFTEKPLFGLDYFNASSRLVIMFPSPFPFDDYRITLSSGEVFTLTEPEARMFPAYTMLGEGYGCSLSYQISDATGSNMERKTIVRLETLSASLFENELNAIEDPDLKMLKKAERSIALSEKFFTSNESSIHISSFRLLYELNQHLSVLGLAMDAHEEALYDSAKLPTNDPDWDVKKSARIMLDLLKARYERFREILGNRDRAQSDAMTSQSGSGQLRSEHKESAVQDTKVLESGEWPVTVEAVVVDIIASLSAEDKKRVRDTSDKDLIRFHFGWGAGIRNHYGLWRGNTQLIESACGGPCHPDDASMIIIKKMWEALRQQQEQVTGLGSTP